MKNSEEKKVGSLGDSPPQESNTELNIAQDSDNVKSENYEDTILRCEDDEPDPFSMISNDLIRDKNLSPECRWLIIYLLSNKEGWQINISQVVNHLKPHMGRSKVYLLFEEAIQAGYIKKEIRFVKMPNGGAIKSGARYTISKTPKFKKCYRNPENRHAGDRKAVKPDVKNTIATKEYYLEEDYYTSLKVSAESLAPSGDMSAKADEKKVDESPPKKSKKAKTDFTAEVIELTHDLIQILKKHEPDYSPPPNLAAFRSEVDFMLRLDKRDHVKICDVLNWALSDSFWRPLMFKPNPAKYLREKFLQLKNKMEAKPPERKIDRKGFAPCSDDAKAIETMREMGRRAL